MNKRIVNALSGILLASLCLGAGIPTAFGQNGTVDIGVITPLTGTNAVQGQDILRGIQLAVKRINSGYEVPLTNNKSKKIGPGVIGKKIKLIVQDNESRPASAIDSAQKLVNVNKVPIILGIYSSGIAVPTGQFTNKNKVIEIAAGSTSPQLKSIGPYFFDVIGLDNLMGEALGKFAIDDSGGKKFASIVPNNPFGVGMELEGCKSIKAHGGECVTKVRYEQGKSDYRPELQRLTSQPVDGVLFTAYGTDSRLILQQAYELGFNVSKHWYADYPTMWTGQIKSHPKLGEGIKGLTVGASTKFYRTEYADAYKKAYGEEPTTAFGGFAYDSMMLTALAIDKAGSTNADALRKALMTVSKDYRGVTGDKTFDANGMQKTEQYKTVIYKGGKLMPYTK